MLQDNLIETVEMLNESKSIEIAKELLKQGLTNQDIIMLLNEGVKRVGDRFESGEYYIGDLIVSGMIYRSVIELFDTTVKKDAKYAFSRVVIGVAKDDIHDIGKDMVVSLLRAEGFEVIDLGVDVKAERFIHAVETYKPTILLVSGLLNCTLDCMREVCESLDRAGLRKGLHVMVGGSAIDETTVAYTGADAATKELKETLKFCKEASKKAGV